MLKPETELDTFYRVRRAPDHLYIRAYVSRMPVATVPMLLKTKRYMAVQMIIFYKLVI